MGKRGGKYGALLPLFFKNVPPNSVMRSVCPVPFAPEQADDVVRGRASAFCADDECGEGGDGRGHDGVDAAHAGLFLLTLLGGVAVQTGTNMLNIYGDYLSGVDTEAPATMEATAPEALASFQ